MVKELRSSGRGTFIDNFTYLIEVPKDGKIKNGLRGTPQLDPKYIKMFQGEEGKLDESSHKSILSKIFG